MKAVIYARYSSDSQREESIEGQIRKCTDYCEKNNFSIVGTYIDRALSARTANRPEFQRMVKDSAKGLFDLVIVWKLDRFARDRYDSAHYKAQGQYPGIHAGGHGGILLRRAFREGHPGAYRKRPEMQV